MTAAVRITHYGHACVLAELPDRTRILLTTDLRLQRAAEGLVRIEVLQGIKNPDPA
jgi:L-ascorbate metabolism protein UlaG (beta-lactamase superfamily)